MINLRLLKKYEGWRHEWSLIVPGEFGPIMREFDNPFTDLLFYNPTGNTGEGEFYSTDGEGRLTLLNSYVGWRREWSLIIPGSFGGSHYTDLLFYDPTRGGGEFYTTDGEGRLTLLNSYVGWRREWSLIIPAHFNIRGHTDLLFYDPTRGEGEFYTTDEGRLTLLRKYRGWRREWSLIIPGHFGDREGHLDFGAPDLLFYDPTRGEGEFYTTDGEGRLSLLKKHTGWRREWSHIIPGNFGGGDGTDLLFYDPTRGEGEFYTIVWRG